MKKNNIKRKSIYFQIITTYLSIYIIFSISLSLAGYFIPKDIINKEIYEELVIETQEFHTAYLSSPENFSEFLGYELEGEGENNLILKLTVDNKTIFENQSENIPKNINILKDKENMKIFDSKDSSNDNHFIFIEKSFPDGLKIIFGENFQKIQYIFNVIRNILIIFNIISILLLYIILKVATKRILFPLKELSEIIEKIPDSQELLINLDYSNYPEEIYRFASRFDTMLSRIKDLMNETRDISNSVAHDIKTPLTNIKMITEELLKESSQREQNKILSLIDNLDRTTYIIDSIMSVAGLVAENRKINLEEVSILPIIKDACELFSDISEEKNISINILSKKNDYKINGNLKSVQRIISNLLDNAIKYTEENGIITISATEKEKIIEISISDTGIGISEGEQSNIFKKFYKVDKSRGSFGIGLGLHTVKILLEQMNGSISCESSLGKGSTFTISFQRSKKAS